MILRWCTDSELFPKKEKLGSKTLILEVNAHLMWSNGLASLKQFEIPRKKILKNRSSRDKFQHIQSKSKQLVIT
jgi:hypothetical protein